MMISIKIDLKNYALSPFQMVKLGKKFAIYGSLLGALALFGLGYHSYHLPGDEIQGFHVRMLFLHVPLAFFSLSTYSFMTACSITYLVWNIKHAFSLAAAAMPIAWFCSAATLITGSLWGYPIWGTFWIWDARLTASLILFLLLSVQEAVLRAPTSQKKRIQQIFSILTIIGSIDLPLVHFSVNWFNTLHQKASISFFDKTTIDLIYLWPLLGLILASHLWGSSYIIGNFTLQLRESLKKDKV